MRGAAYPQAVAVAAAAVAVVVAERSRRRSAVAPVAGPTGADGEVATGAPGEALALRHLLDGALAGALAVLLAVVAGLATSDTFVFGAMFVAYAAVVVGVPLAAAALLVLDRSAGHPGHHRRPATTAVLVLGLVPAVVGAYGTYVEPDRLVADVPAPVVLPAADRGDRPLRIAVLADLQFTEVGDHERAAVQAVVDARPDVVLVAGDVVQGTPAEREAVLPDARALLGRLHAPGGVFLVGGDQDHPAPAWLPRLVEGTDVRFLRNEVATTEVAGHRLAVAGIELDYTTPEAVATVHRLEEGDRHGEVRILLAHRPDAVTLLGDPTAADLVVAGHTHGGQVALPWIGPPITFSDLPREVAAGGLHAVDGHRLFVTRGVGVERGGAPRVRLGVPPEWALLTVVGGRTS